MKVTGFTLQTSRARAYVGASRFFFWLLSRGVPIDLPLLRYGDEMNERKDGSSLLCLSFTSTIVKEGSDVRRWKLRSDLG